MFVTFVRILSKKFYGKDFGAVYKTKLGIIAKLIYCKNILNVAHELLSETDFQICVIS